VPRPKQAVNRMVAKVRAVPECSCCTRPYQWGWIIEYKRPYSECCNEPIVEMDLLTGLRYSVTNGQIVDKLLFNCEQCKDGD